MFYYMFFFFKQKTAYELRISDWSSDVCSSDLREVQLAFRQPGRVAEMAFQEGDVVTAGTRMALLDAQPYEDALAAAEAAVRVAQAEVDKLHGGLRPQEVAKNRSEVRRGGKRWVSTCRTGG